MVPLGASYQEETLSGTTRRFLSLSGELGGHQGWGNPGPGAGGTAWPVMGEPLGRSTLRHALLEKVRTPSGKPGWGTTDVNELQTTCKAKKREIVAPEI